MSKIVFFERGQPSARIGTTPQTGFAGARGPQNFPPPPPPPVVPLNVVAIKVSSLDPQYLEWYLDGTFYVEDVLPTWTTPEHVGDPAPKFDVLYQEGVGLCCVPVHSLVAGNHVVVPGNMPGIRSLSGGYVTPSTYVVGAA